MRKRIRCTLIKPGVMLVYEDIGPMAERGWYVRIEGPDISFGPYENENTATHIALAWLEFKREGLIQYFASKKSLGLSDEEVWSALYAHWEKIKQIDSLFPNFLPT